MLLRYRQRSTRRIVLQGQQFVFYPALILFDTHSRLYPLSYECFCLLISSSLATVLLRHRWDGVFGPKPRADDNAGALSFGWLRGRFVISLSVFIYFVYC